jgi:NitT/TauT family transport system substrate-binding protein/putative hydroxymethylpyrimidine transport system substrate-binding protein
MRRVAALLAAALVAAAGCGGGGAEPGAPEGSQGTSRRAPERADLVLDFQPNAVHAGLYAALERGYFRKAGANVRIHPPSASTDGPRLLSSGRADFAVLDIHDLGLARERGLDVVGITALVQRPLAALLARRDGPVRRPRDLEGRRAGVTGLPSDDAVLDSIVANDGGDPDRVRRVTIGFKAVASLAAGRVAAATGFWNAEGRALRRRAVPIREFRLDRYGAPPYPELVVATTRRLLRRDPGLARAVVAGVVHGYRLVVRHPNAALDHLLAREPALDRGVESDALRSLLPVMRPAGALRPSILRAWARWDVAHHLLHREPRIAAAFDLRFAPG